MVHLTRFERTRLVSSRALQISMGAPPLIKVLKNIDSYTIAKKEFEKDIMPLTVLRKLPSGEVLKVQ